MQKMMKLSDAHYILVDESDIKVGDIVVEKLLTGRYELFEIHTLNDIDKSTQKKVIHSTQSLLDVVMWLYEKHGIWISVDVINNLFKYKILQIEGIVSKTFGNEIRCSSFDYNSPKEAYDAAIIYTLNNLI